MTGQVEGQLSLFDLDTWSSKTSLDYSAAMPEKTSRQSSRKSSESSSRTLPMCLCLIRNTDGASQDASTMIWGNGALLGDYTMDSFGEQPSTLMKECTFGGHRNGVSESHLSQILVDYQHQTFSSNEKAFQRYMDRYKLSAKACSGILRRAEKRGKELPEILRTALENQVNDG